MKIQITAILAFLILAASPVNALEQTEEGSQRPQMMQRMREMMEARRLQTEEQNALFEQLRASTERLDALVESMNAAEGDAKTDAIATLVTELVSQHHDLLDLVEPQPSMMERMQMNMMDMMQQMMERIGGGDTQ